MKQLKIKRAGKHATPGGISFSNIYLGANFFTRHKLPASKLMLMAVLAFSSSVLMAQDLIPKNDKPEIKTKVVETTNEVVKSQSNPTHDLTQLQVSNVTYQNSKKEFMVNAGNSNKSQTGNSNAGITTIDPQYTFTPRDMSQPKSNTNFADRMGNIGVALNTIGKSTIPGISVITDIFVAPNIAVSFGVLGSYNKEEMMGYSASALSIGLLAGGSYYLNELLKLDKAKGSVYGGLALAYTSTSITSDLPGGNVSSGSFNGLLRAGGRYNLAKHFGVFSEVQFGKGDPAIVAGIAIINIK